MLARLFGIAVFGVMLTGVAAGQSERTQREFRSPCPTNPVASGKSTPVPYPPLTNGLPTSVALTVLGTGQAAHLPKPPARLQLTYLTLAPGAGADSRQTVGPILFYVVEGRITLYVGGKPQTLEHGESVLIQLGEIYAVINDGGAPATLLRLAVAPRDAVDQPVSVVVTPPPLLLTPVPPPTGTLLFRAEVQDHPLTSARLFLICLRWYSPGSESGNYRYPGPVGVRVVSGELTVDGTRQIPESGCALLEANATHRLQSADAPPVVLMFGAIPSRQDLWLPADASTTTGVPPGPANLTCGDS
jgi:quercetin dioxygenase-like cupin family protein